MEITDHILGGPGHFRHAPESFDRGAEGAGFPVFLLQLLVPGLCGAQLFLLAVQVFKELFGTEFFRVFAAAELGQKLLFQFVDFPDALFVFFLQFVYFLVQLVQFFLGLHFAGGADLLDQLPVFQVSGVIFKQHIADPRLPIFRGFDDNFAMPHSRHSEVRACDIETDSRLHIIADSPESGVGIVMAREGREFFITGHMEYNPDTLDNEYRRDIGIRDDVELPHNYYRNDDPEQGPMVTWRAHANLLFANWINYYVYQTTPYDINAIR